MDGKETKETKEFRLKYVVISLAVDLHAGFQHRMVKSHQML